MNTYSWLVFPNLNLELNTSLIKMFDLREISKVGNSTTTTNFIVLHRLDRWSPLLDTETNILKHVSHNITSDVAI